MGAQLGDLVVAGQGQQQQQMVFVLNQTGSLALWNVNTKIAQDATSVGSQTTDSLGLYRIANGETGSPGTRYGYLTGETQYLTGVNGNGTGPYTMKALAEYSTNLTSSEVMLEGNWFMGKGGQGYYVYNSMTFQGFNFGSTVSTLGSGGTTIGAVDLVQTLWKGQKPTGLGVIGTTISVATMIYGARMYRPTYTLSPCSSFGVNYCGAYR